MVHQDSTHRGCKDHFRRRSRDTSEGWWHLGAAWWAQTPCQRSNGCHFHRSSSQESVTCDLQWRLFAWAAQDAVQTLLFIFFVVLRACVQLLHNQRPFVHHLMAASSFCHCLQALFLSSNSNNIIIIIIKNDNNKKKNNKNNNNTVEVCKHQEPHAWLHDPKADRGMAVIVDAWLPKAAQETEPPSWWLYSWWRSDWCWGSNWWVFWLQQ